MSGGCVVVFKGCITPISCVEIFCWQSVKGFALATCRSFLAGNLLEVAAFSKAALHPFTLQHQLVLQHGLILYTS
jgi:hypothetical protein